jgi:hypothetical protein
MGILDSFTNPGRPYEKAQDALKQGWQQGQQYQQPFWQGGVDQLPWLNNRRDQLGDPGKLQNEWAQGYQMSPYAQDLMQRSLASGRDEASSMGLQGSSAALGNAQQTAGAITSQDRQRYMDDMMQKYMASIGIGQNLYGIGAQTGANLGNQAMQFGRDNAGLEYGKAGAAGQMWGNLIGAGAPLVGAAVGGPAGAAIGGEFGKRFQQGFGTPQYDQGQGRSPGTGVY